MHPAVLVVAGVAGSGKTSVGLLVASDLGWPFADGDSFHTSASVAKMRSGAPLTDADRQPWLRAIAGWIGEREAAGGCGVVACSALKRVYRDRLRHGHPTVRFAFLTAPAAVLHGRLRGRQQHFVPASLLASQLADLERLGPDEPGGLVDASGPAEQTAAAVRALVEQPA
ncbi:MAG TPA: gluconokinase [Jatrophihabitantaceae bacterium]